MNASGKRSSGYGRKEKRLAKVAAEPRQAWKARKSQNDEAKWREALEAMLATIRELLEAQRRSRAGKREVDEYAAVLRKVLRHVRRRMRRTEETVEPAQPSSRKKRPSASGNIQGGGKGKPHR